jgi:hypothetical protein
MLDFNIQAVKYLEPQIRLAAKAGKCKKEYKLSMVSDRTLEKVRNLAEAPIEAVFTDPSYGKVHTTFVDDNKHLILGNYFPAVSLHDIHVCVKVWRLHFHFSFLKILCCVMN